MAFATDSFVYEWTDHYNGMFYIGYHKGSPDDGYIGSGKLFKKAYARNPHLFTREIIAQGSDSEMKELERKMLKEVNAANNPRYYNLRNIGNGGYSHTSESKQKISEASKGNQYAKGYKHTAEAKEKISEAGKGNQYRKGHAAWNKGKPHSKEQIDKFLASRTYNKYTEEQKAEHSARMKLWWSERKAKNVCNR